MKQMETFGDWLRNKRQELRVSGAELERKTGISRSYISNLERNLKSDITGKLVQPSVEKVDALATGLGVPIDEARLAAGYAPTHETDSHDLDGVFVSFDGAASLTDEEKTELLSAVRLIAQGIKARKAQE